MTAGHEDPDSGGMRELLERIQALHDELRQRLGAGVDAVTLPSGESLLLREGQEDLRRREADQRRHAQQRSAILNALPAHIALLAADGTIVSTNESWERFGQDQGLACRPSGNDYNYLQVCDGAAADGDADAAEAAAGIRAVLSGARDQFVMEYPCHTPERQQWFRLLVSPLADVDTAGAVVMHLDVTTEYQARLQLAESERQFRAMFQSNPLPMWVFDVETLAFLAVNDAAVAHYGYSREEFLAMTIVDIRPESELPRLEKVLQAGTEDFSKSEDWLHRTRDGSLIRVEISSHSVQFDGRAARLVLVNDITERRRVEHVRTVEARVLEGISSGGELSAVLEDIARGIEELHPETLASILLLDTDADVQRLRHGAAPSLPEAFVEGLDGLAIGPDTGSCGTAMYRGETVIVEDIRTDPLWAEYVDLAESAGLRACWSVPIFDAQRTVLGSLALYYRNPLEPTARERELVERFSHLAGIAIARHRGEHALRRSENRLRKVFSDAATGIAVITRQGAFVQVNRAFARMLGHDEEAFGDLRYPDLVHPDDRQESTERIASLLSGEDTVATLEMRYLTRAGDKVWCRVRLSSQSDSQGQPVRIIAVTEDITRRKEMEQRLHTSRMLQRIAGHIGRVGGWAVDTRNERLFWSEEVYHMLEWPIDEPPDLETGMALFIDSDRERMRKALERCAGDAQPFELELSLRDYHGRRMLVRFAGESEVRGQPGHQVVGAAQDITEQRRVETMRQQLAERLESILQNMSEAFCLLNNEWRFVYLNREAERVLRVNSGDVVGQKMLDAFPDVKDTEMEARYLHAVKTGQPAHFESYYPGLEEWFEINAHPSPEGLAVYFRVTTGERMMREQLQQSQRLEAVGQLTGGVAHDFNNLLTVILGNAEILADSLASDANLLPMARLIGNAAQRGAELTQRLLAFARRQPLEPRAVDVNRLIAEMDQLLRRSLGEQVELEFTRGAGLWTALVDPGQLESALLNLAINARDAMPGGGRLTVETANMRIDEEYAARHADLEPGQYVMVGVTDTGSGIAPEVLEKVFEPFYTTKEKGKGTGLGLSMVYGFVKQSRGNVKIYSEPGEGTTVRMYLPRADADEADVPETESLNQAVGGRESILLVEDDALVRAYAEQQLRELGYRVRVAEHGQRALEILESGATVELLFTDVIMPGGMSGRELADRARKICPGLRVLYTSGYTENAIVHQGRLDPGVQLLSKPYRRSELARRVRRALDAPMAPGSSPGGADGRKR